MLQIIKKTPLNILLADDDADDRYFFDKALKELTIPTNLKTVHDGERLMNYLSVNEEHLPDIIFLDINMPRKNGLECLTEIKGSEKLKKIPVVLCSTSLGDDFADKLYQTGAHYYMHKSDFSDLTKFIQMVLNLLAENPVQPPRNEFTINLLEA